MPSIDDIIGQFQSFNIEVNDEVVSKCLEMCQSYNLDPEDLVDQWFAYTTSVLRGAAPTVEYLKKMERKEFLKNVEPLSKTMTPVEQSYHGFSTFHQSSSPSTDVSGTPKGTSTHMSKIRTPVQSRKLLDELMESPISSPVTSSGTYSSRTDAQSILLSYGPNDVQFETEPNTHLMPFFNPDVKPFQSFMYEVLGKRATCLNKMTEYVLQDIVKKYKLDMYNEEKPWYLGRIVADTDGKINVQSILLEQSQDVNGSTVYLILSNLSKYTLFPGQCVAVTGSYERTPGRDKDKIIVDEIYAETDMNFLEEPPLIRDSLKLIVASGPFTTQDNLLFEPLNDLLQYAKECKPDVLLLMGPFYEGNHPGITNGQLRQSFESLFFDIMDNVMKALENIGIQVIVVASQREPHHFPIYPTLPYEIREKYANLTFIPDPGLLNLDGLLIGATTADVLFDISNFEIHLDKHNSSPPDRMGRLASHILKQQSFYPLHPPFNGMSIDMSLMATKGILKMKPHILILPSSLKHFVKEVDECVIINPGRLSKGNGGGTFARIVVGPGLTKTVCGRTTCQILKI